MIRLVQKFNSPVLKARCLEVIEFNDELRTIVQDMKDTMIKNNGIGLAAPQIGITKNIIVVTDIETDEIIEVINPVITYKSENTEIDFEGCLSYPNKRKKIYRPSEVHIKGFNQFGVEVEYKVSGYQARIFCHEIDHLNGRCLVA